MCGSSHEIKSRLRRLPTTFFAHALARERSAVAAVGDWHTHAVNSRRGVVCTCARAPESRGTHGADIFDPAVTVVDGRPRLVDAGDAAGFHEWCSVSLQRAGSTLSDGAKYEVPTPSLLQLVMLSMSQSAGASSVAVAVAARTGVVG